MVYDYETIRRLFTSFWRKRYDFYFFIILFRSRISAGVSSTCTVRKIWDSFPTPSNQSCGLKS